MQWVSHSGDTRGHFQIFRMLRLIVAEVTPSLMMQMSTFIPILGMNK